MSPIYDIYKQVGKQLNIPAIRVRLVYQVYWSILKDYMESLPLKEIDTLDEEPVIQISSIGKLYCDKKWFYKQKRKYERIKNKGHKADVQLDTSDS